MPYGNNKDIGRPRFQIKTFQSHVQLRGLIRSTFIMCCIVSSLVSNLYFQSLSFKYQFYLTDRIDIKTPLMT